MRDGGRPAEVIFATKVEGQATVTIRLSYAQAATLADLLEPFRKNTIDPKRPEGSDG